MTTYRLFDGAAGRPSSGPASATVYSGGGPWCAGLNLGILAPVWLQGYWWWVASGSPVQSTAPQKFALWSVTGASSGSLVAGSVVTSGTLSAGWNFVPLPSPLPLTPGTQYVPATGWTAAAGGGFPFTTGYFNGAGTFPAGIVNGPLRAYADGTQGGSPMNPWGGAIGGAGLWSTSNADPAAAMPLSSSNSANTWLDVQVTDTAPAGWTGPEMLRPNSAAFTAATSADASADYEVAVELIALKACKVTAVRYYSPAGATQLATWCGVWDVASKALLSANRSPSWSGAAGSGWLQAPVPAVPVAAGQRVKLAAYNGAATPGACFAKDVTDLWGTGVNSGGISWTLVQAPGLAASSPAYNYNGNAGGTPPYSDGTLLAHGQSTFAQTANGAAGDPPYPQLWANAGTGSGTQDYAVDGVFTAASGSGALMAAGII